MGTAVGTCVRIADGIVVCTCVGSGVGRDVISEEGNSVRGGVGSGKGLSGLDAIEGVGTNETGTAVAGRLKMLST